MKVDVVVFDGVDELDVFGPLEVFRRAAAIGAEVSSRFCANQDVEWVNGAAGTRFQPDCQFQPAQADVVVVPGGGWVARADTGAWAEVKRGELPPVLAHAAASGSVMAGVCTGTMLLAHAGLVEGRRATTHHDALPDLAAMGASVVVERVVDEGDLVTCGGVTSGIDLALWLLARHLGEGLAEVVADGLEYTWQGPHRRGADVTEPS